MIRKDAPEGARVLDLEEAQAARAEARKKAGESGPLIKISAGYVETNPEFPLDIVERVTRGDIRGMLAGLLVDPDDVDVLLSAGVSAADLKAIVAFLGVSLGEALASSSS